MQLDSAFAIAVGSYVTSVFLNKAADVVFDAALEEAGRRLFNFVKGAVIGDSGSRGGVRLVAEVQPDSSIIRDAEVVAESSPVLRRARMVASVLEGAQVLWVDDNLGNNIYERMTLKSMGVIVDLALSTDEAMVLLSNNEYDLIISDMARDGVKDAGLQLLHKVQSRVFYPQVIFYVGILDRQRGTPPGAFAITNRPDDLLHYVLDVLERKRV